MLCKQTVEPPFSTPYLIFVCLKTNKMKKNKRSYSIYFITKSNKIKLKIHFAKSSALSIGESIRSTVRKAAKLAVYDEI